MIKITFQAQDKVKTEIAEPTLAKEKKIHLDVELRNQETALQALVTLWHIAYQDATGEL